LISAYDGKKKYFLKPHKIKVMDRTGAGDAFASGFVAGRVTGKSIQDSLKLGLRESEAEIKYHGVKNKLLRMKLR
jgi:ribokinase